jgi:ribosomal protein L11 methyltransferase
VNRLFAAIDIRWTSHPGDDELGRLMAALDDFRPTAVDDLPDGIRVFFARPHDRDRAVTSAREWGHATAVSASDVPDENWAERSQASVRAVRVRNIIVAPPWDSAAAPSEPSLVIVIQPSMGFGTGHHASTRLCLELLQDEPVPGASVIDVGTGSGVLAIAAWRLGATRVVGIDVDPDAVASARESADLNAAASGIDLRVADFQAGALELGGPCDLVTANLTGAMIERHADGLARLLRPGGTLIASGFQIDEEPAVVAALNAAGLGMTRRCVEDEWVGLAVSAVERTGVRSSKFEV